MTAPDFRKALEAACLEGLVLTGAGYKYRPATGADAVLALLAERLDGDEVREAVADAGGLGNYCIHTGPVVNDGCEDCRRLADAALVAVRDYLGVTR